MGNKRGHHQPRIIGKKTPPMGEPPAVLMINPKYEVNVVKTIRTCSCFGVGQLWFTGDRVKEPGEGQRLPREERMKAYQDVDLINFDYPFDMFPKVPVVGVEVQPGAVPLPQFEHPENALYMFGPEDGGLSSMERRHVHHFVSIPTRHCLNLAVAVSLVLYDRQAKLHPEATLDDLLKDEQRGFIEDPQTLQEMRR